MNCLPARERTRPGSLRTEGTGPRPIPADPFQVVLDLTLGRPASAQAFENQCHALTATDAHRFQTELLVVVLQRVDQRRGDAGAGHAEGVTDSDRAAVDVELVELE